LYVDVDIDHGAGYGNTLFWEATNSVPPYERLATVQFDLDTERFYRIYIDLMTRPQAPSPHLPRAVYGVDFSGAKDAGNRIWVAHGTIEGEFLRLDRCVSARDLPGSGRDLEKAIYALREFIVRCGDCAVGLDFPFGLPKKLVEEESWQNFVRRFPSLYSTAEHMKKRCWETAGERELWRVTDTESRVPFAAYNLKLYRQTYYGIRDLLRPLACAEAVNVLPMQGPTAGRPWLMEICPASTLKSLGIHESYKGRADKHCAGRKRVLKKLEVDCKLTITDDALRAKILENCDGDALDSVIAALAVFRALSKSGGLAATGNATYALEGYIYV
jgi:hypothetical protein